MKNKLIVIFIVIFLLVWWHYLADRYPLAAKAKSMVVNIVRAVTEDGGREVEEVNVPFETKEEAPSTSTSPFKAGYNENF